MRRQPVKVAVRCRPATKLDGRDACIAVEGDAVTVVSGEEEAGFSWIRGSAGFEPLDEYQVGSSSP